LLKVGLTGGIGCGKSTAVRMFAALGWYTVQSDELVRDLLSEDSDVRMALIDRWGKRVQDDNGNLNRKEIAGIVFKDTVELKWLESVLHPKVRQRWETAVKVHKNEPVIVEIPLLYEKSLETAFDFIVCISSPKEIVSERMSQRGYSEAEVEQRRSHQLPLTEKIRRSDYVISNAGSLEFLEKQIQRLSDMLKQSQT
jgi:dephospho-CoA kinase